MPYTRIEFVKLFLELFTEDDRFLFQLTDSQQLLYIKFLVLAGMTGNKIPKSFDFIKSKINYHNSIEQFELDKKTLISVFPKLQEHENCYSFMNFKRLHNFKYDKRLDKKTSGELLEEEKEIEEEKEKERFLVAPSLLDEIFNHWNNQNPTNPLKFLSDKRKKKLRARFQEEAFRDGWRIAIDKLAASDFATGKNDRGWRASFDWLIENDNNYVKAIEGRYDNRRNGTAPTERLRQVY